MQKFANPYLFLKMANAVLPVLWVVTAVLFILGIYGAFGPSPADYQQGETMRIMYIHVPSAWIGMFAYGLMAFASAIAVIFRHPLADAAAKTAAPLGAVFCFLALVTGSIWGKPTWGTWWVWDARITSMFILLLLYIGYMAIWQAIEDQHLAAVIARVVALVGSLILPVIKFSVEYWNTLHQPASILKMGGPTIDKSMLWVLLIMALAYTTLFMALHLVSLRTEIALRKISNARLSEIRGR